MIQKIFVVVFLLVSVTLSSAQTAPSDPTHRLARAILEELVNVPSTESGVGSTPAVEFLVKRYRAAGFAEPDLFVGGPEPKKQNVVVRLRGTGQGKPILLLAHLDVVEANKADWSPDLDPFKFIERDGYFYGRGTQAVSYTHLTLPTILLV